jgi:hypothetical protein
MNSGEARIPVGENEEVSTAAQAIERKDKEAKERNCKESAQGGTINKEIQDAELPKGKPTRPSGKQRQMGWRQQKNILRGNVGQV